MRDETASVARPTPVTAFGDHADSGSGHAQHRDAQLADPLGLKRPFDGGISEHS